MQTAQCIIVDQRHLHQAMHLLQTLVALLCHLLLRLQFLLNNILRKLQVISFW